MTDIRRVKRCIIIIIIIIMIITVFNPLTDNAEYGIRHETGPLGNRVNGSSFTSRSLGHHFDPV